MPDDQITLGQITALWQAVSENTQAIEELIEAIKESSGIKKVADAITVSGLSDLAKETTLGDVKTAVESIAGEDFATESTLGALKTLLENGTAKMQLSGSVPPTPLKGDITFPAGFLNTEIPAGGTLVSDWIDVSGFTMAVLLTYSTPPNNTLRWVSYHSATSGSLGTSPGRPSLSIGDLAGSSGFPHNRIFALPMPRVRFAVTNLHQTAAVAIGTNTKLTGIRLPMAAFPPKDVGDLFNPPS